MSFHQLLLILQPSHVEFRVIWNNILYVDITEVIEFSFMKDMDYLDSCAVIKFILLDCKLAFTSMMRRDWRTSKHKVYNWPSNKSDLQWHYDRLSSLGPSHTIRKSIGINSGPRITCERPLTDLWYFATD